MVVVRYRAFSNVWLLSMAIPVDGMVFDGNSTSIGTDDDSRIFNDNGTGDTSHNFDDPPDNFDDPPDIKYTSSERLREQSGASSGASGLSSPSLGSCRLPAGCLDDLESMMLPTQKNDASTMRNASAGSDVGPGYVSVDNREVEKRLDEQINSTLTPLRFIRNLGAQARRFWKKFRSVARNVDGHAVERRASNESRCSSPSRLTTASA